MVIYRFLPDIGEVAISNANAIDNANAIGRKSSLKVILADDDESIWSNFLSLTMTCMPVGAKRGSRGGALVAAAPRGMNRKRERERERDRKRERKKKERKKERKKDLLQSCNATPAVIKLLTPLRHRHRSWGWGSIAWSV